MFELFALGFAVAVALAVIALLCWVFVIPFQLLSMVFKGLAVLLLLPFLVVFGIIAAALFGVGFLLFAIPALPLLVIVGVIWWLASRRRHPHPA
jgi:hypothetical protein